MLEFTRVSRWFRVADGYTLRYSNSSRSWRVCAPGGKVLGVVGDVIEAERLANQHADDAATAEAAVSASEEDEPGPPYGPVAAPIEPDLFQYLTEGHGSARMVTEADDDTGDVTMKPCQCLIPTSEIEDGALVVAPCGGEVPNKRAFKPGHDAKLKSTMIKAHRNGGTLIIRDGGSRTETTAKAIAKERGWERFLTDAPARKPRKGKADTANGDDAVFAGDRGELDPESLREPVGASQPARVKVRGAWKDGFVTKVEAGETASSPQAITVSYTNAKRKQVEITLKSDSDKLQLG